ncbi:unnamed protein product [Arabidopsis halleri]
MDKTNGCLQGSEPSPYLVCCYKTMKICLGFGNLDFFHNSSSLGFLTSDLYDNVEALVGVFRDLGTRDEEAKGSLEDLTTHICLRNLC